MNINKFTIPSIGENMYEEQLKKLSEYGDKITNLRGYL